MWIKKYNRPANVQFDELVRGPMLVNNPYYPNVIKSFIGIPAGHATMDNYVKSGEWDVLMKKISTRILAGPDFVARHRRAYGQTAERYVRSARRIPKQLHAQSAIQLWRYYKAFVDWTKRMWLFFYAPWALNEVVEPYFQKQVQARLPEHAASILEAVGGLSQEVRFNIQLKGLLRLKKSSRLSKRALERHARRWGYLKIYVPNHVPYQPHEFRQMVHGTRASAKLDHLEKTIRRNRMKFLQATRLMRQYPRLTEIAELLHWYVYLRNERIDCYREATFHVRRLFQELDQRLGLADCQSSFMTIREIEDYLREGIKPALNIIRRRSTASYAWYIHHGRMELIHSQDAIRRLHRRVSQGRSTVKSIRGVVAYPGKTTGRVKIIHSHDEVAKVKPGDILVTPMTHPEYIHIMKQSAAFVTDEGGITCHAAIMAREFKKPCVIGTKIATKVLKDGDKVEVDATKGIVRKL